MKLSVIYCALCLSAILAWSTPSHSYNGKQAKPTISKQQAARIAKQRVNGKVLKVVQTNGNYKVKVLTKSGRVVSVKVNGKGKNQ